MLKFFLSQINDLTDTQLLDLWDTLDLSLNRQFFDRAFKRTKIGKEYKSILERHLVEGISRTEALKGTDRDKNWMARAVRSLLPKYQEEVENAGLKIIDHYLIDQHYEDAFLRHEKAAVEVALKKPSKSRKNKPE